MSAGGVSTKPRALLRDVARGAVVVLLVLVVNLVLGYCVQPQTDDTGRREYDRPAWGYAAAWKQQYGDEFTRSWAFLYEPFVGWRRRDFRGRYINISGGIRSSYRGKQAAGAIRIFFLGGSTTWGTGARDEYTIPSLVARLAEARGWPVEVTNFGESAFSSFQEAILLSRLVATGNIPDVVVFYDGVNDLLTQLEEGPSSVPIHNQLSRFRERIEKADDPWRILTKYSFLHVVWRRLVNKESLQITAPPDTYATNIVKLRGQALDLAFHLGHELGFPVISFHQPWIFTKKLLPDEQLPEVGGCDPRTLQAIAKAADSRTRGDSRIVDITDALDEVKEAVMIDAIHTNEIGNQVIAERIFKTLSPIIEQLVKAKHSPQRF